MASQDENRDDFLNDIDEWEDSQKALGVDDISDMTEDDIEKLLMANQEPQDEEEDNDFQDLFNGLDSETDVEEGTGEAGEDNDLLHDLFYNMDSDREAEEEKSQKKGLGAKLREGKEARQAKKDKKAVEQTGRQMSQEEKKAQKQAQKEARREAKEAAKQAKKEAREKKKAAKQVETEEVLSANGENAPQGQEAGAAPDLASEETEKLFAGMEALDQLEKDMDINGNDNDINDNDINDNDIMNELTALGLDNDMFGDLMVNDASGSGDETGEESLLAGDHPKAEQADSENPDAEPENKKKKGFFARLFDLMTEEEPDEQDSLKLSEENEEILREMDQQEGKKKKKKNKKKAGGEEEEADAGRRNADAEDEEEGEEKKKKKEKKPKKEKAPKPSSDDGKPSRKLPKRKVALIFLACLSVGGAILIVSSAGVDFADKQAAEQAYYKGDYETCYQNLTGKDLNESQKVMYGKSESILRIRMWMKEYEILTAEEAYVEALDSLIQSVHDYPKLSVFSKRYNASSEVAEIYEQILGILDEKYHLSEEEARKISNERNDVEYTKMVKGLVEGKKPNFGENVQEEVVPQEPLKDELPEEADLGNVVFIDNNN